MLTSKIFCHDQFDHLPVDHFSGSRDQLISTTLSQLKSMSEGCQKSWMSEIPKMMDKYIPKYN